MLKSGDILYFHKHYNSPSGVEYQRGDTLQLIEPTGQAPFGLLSRLGNWSVKCKAFRPPMSESIWSGIWMFIEYGILSKEKP